MPATAVARGVRSGIRVARPPTRTTAPKKQLMAEDSAGLRMRPTISTILRTR